MPLQIIPQQNQPVGLQLLGETIMGGATDYAAKRRQDELMAKQRAERLADIESARGFETKQFDKARTLQLQDEQRRRGETFEDAKKRASFERRLAMLAEAERRGLFNAKQVGDLAAEEAALSALQAQLAKETAFSQDQPLNAQARLAELGKAEREVTQKMANVEARLSAQPTVNQADVIREATMIATQANGGKMPSREQIQAAYPDALDKAKEAAQMRWYQDQRDATVQYQILSSQLNTIRGQQANITSTFKVAPLPNTAVLSPPPEEPGDASVSRGNPLDEFTRALDAKLAAQRGAGGPTATSNDGVTVQNITSALSTAPAAAAPILRQARTSMLAGEYAKLDDPIMETESKLTDVQQKLARLQSGLNPMQAVTPAPLAVPPQVQGEFMTKLLLQQSALQRQLQQQKAARGAGKTSLLSGIPSITPAAFVPASPPSMGSLLSDPGL